jgi:hypothetical protein
MIVRDITQGCERWNSQSHDRPNRVALIQIGDRRTVGGMTRTARRSSMRIATPGRFQRTRGQPDPTRR